MSMDARLWSGERGRTLPILLAWFGCVGLAGPAAGGDDRALLRESLAVGTCTQVQIEAQSRRVISARPASRGDDGRGEAPQAARP